MQAWQAGQTGRQAKQAGKQAGELDGQARQAVVQACWQADRQARRQQPHSRQAGQAQGLATRANVQPDDFSSYLDFHSTFFSIIALASACREVASCGST